MSVLKRLLEHLRFGPPLWLTIPLLLLSSCVGLVGVTSEEPKASIIKEELSELLGSTTSEVRQRLGRPKLEFAEADRTYFVYETHLDVTGLAFVGLLPILWLPPEAEALRCSKLAFGSDGRLESFETYGGPLLFEIVTPDPSSEPGTCEYQFLSGEEQGALERSRRAAAIEARKAGSEARQAAFKDMLARAECGEMYGQYVTGLSYQHGLDVAQDEVAALFWLSLAASHKSSFAGQHHLDELAKEMTREQIADAERLVAEWEPKECELGSAQASN